MSILFLFDTRLCEVDSVVANANLTLKCHEFAVIKQAFSSNCFQQVKSYCFEADSSSTMKLWMSALQDAIQRAKEVSLQ